MKFFAFPFTGAEGRFKQIVSYKKLKGLNGWPSDRGGRIIVFILHLQRIKFAFPSTSLNE